MILKGSQRSGASALADHLMNDRDNDHVEVLEIDGFMADDLHGAFQEAYAISKATQCTQYLFSLSLNPPRDHTATDQEFFDAVERAGEKLGLSDQPRAIIVHEKQGRRHAHVVWSRIDAEKLTAINLPHFKNKLQDVSRDLYLDHGWVLPEGLQAHGGKNPLNFTLEEWQQAKRIDLDPREIKQVFRDAWERSDNLKSLSNAMEERGYFLAKGDRRGFVALDIQGNIYALGKWAGVKAKEVGTKLGSPDGLMSVEDTRRDLKSRVTDQLKSYITETKAKHARDAEPLMDAKRQMRDQHRLERQKLKRGQDRRWFKETSARSSRLNKGLHGLFDRLSGKAKSTIKRNEAEAFQALLRDRAQKEELIAAQMKERQALQKDFIKLNSKQKQDRRILSQNISQYLRSQRRNRARGPQESQDQDRSLRRSRGSDLSL